MIHPVDAIRDHLKARQKLEAISPTASEEAFSSAYKGVWNTLAVLEKIVLEHEREQEWTSMQS